MICHVYFLPQVLAEEKNNHLETENCESCRASQTPKAIENLKTSLEKVIPQICSSSMELTGIAYSDDPTKSRAIVLDKTAGKSSLYGIGKNIPSIGTVKQITERNGIVVTDENNDDKRFLKFCVPLNTNPDQTVPTKVSVPAPVLKPITQNVRIERTEIEGDLDNFSGLLTRAKTTPHLVDKKVVGIAITDIQSGSIYDKIKLQEGDVFKKVNNMEATDPAMILNLFNMMKNEKHIRIDVLRNNQPVTLYYTISK